MHGNQRVSVIPRWLEKKHVVFMILSCQRSKQVLLSYCCQLDVCEAEKNIKKWMASWLLSAGTARQTHLMHVFFHPKWMTNNALESKRCTSCVGRDMHEQFQYFLNTCSLQWSLFILIQKHPLVGSKLLVISHVVLTKIVIFFTKFRWSIKLLAWIENI